MKPDQPRTAGEAAEAGQPAATVGAVAGDESGLHWGYIALGVSVVLAAASLALVLLRRIRLAR